MVLMRMMAMYHRTCPRCYGWFADDANATYAGGRAAMEHVGTVGGKL